MTVYKKTRRKPLFQYTNLRQTKALTSKIPSKICM